MTIINKTQNFVFCIASRRHYSILQIAMYSKDCNKDFWICSTDFVLLQGCPLWPEKHESPK